MKACAIFPTLCCHGSRQAILYTWSEGLDYCSELKLRSTTSAFRPNWESFKSISAGRSAFRKSLYSAQCLLVLAWSTKVFPQYNNRTFCSSVSLWFDPDMLSIKMTCLSGETVIREKINGFRTISEVLPGWGNGFVSHYGDKRMRSIVHTLWSKMLSCLNMFRCSYAL